MGSGTVVVVSKDRKPLRDQAVTIDFNWIGVGTGGSTINTNNLGEAIFNGNPAFSQGRGTVKSPLGQFAQFTVGTNAFGDFDRKEVQVTWNPIASATDTVKDVASGVVKTVVQIGILGAVLLGLILVAATYLKRNPIGKVLRR